jgi:multiple sugar transport system substrate-binding protein
VKRTLIMLVVVLALLVSACAAPVAPAPGGAASSDAPMTQAEQPVTLTIWSTGGDSDVSILEAAAEVFQETHPNVSFEIQAVPWGDAHAKILTAAASKSGPDLMTGGLSWGIEFGELGGMLDLRGYDEMIKEIEAVVHPGIYESVVSMDNSVYGVPWDLTVEMMYYRPDILEEVGAAVPPTTWEEMVDAIEKLRAADKSGFAIAWGNLDWLGYQSFLMQAGGSFYNDNCTESTVNSDAAVQAAKFFTDLYKEYGVTPDSADLEGGLESGEYGFGKTGQWSIIGMAARPDLEGKWAVAPLPTGPSGKRTAFIGGRIIGIMSYTNNANVAAEFIRSLYNEDTAKAMTVEAAMQNALFVPPRTDFADMIQLPEDRLEALKAQLEDAVGPPRCPGWEEGNNNVSQALQAMVFEDADPQVRLDQVADILTQLLGQ